MFNFNNGIALPVDPSDRIQRVWDAPGITKDKAEVLAAATTDMDKARLLAISAPHSSDCAACFLLRLASRQRGSKSCCRTTARFGNVRATPVSLWRHG